MEYYRRDELYHHGIKGQRWGIRRFQNEDGSLTPAGVKRYGDHGSEFLSAKKAYKKARRNANAARTIAGIANVASRGNFAANTVANIAGASIISPYARKEKEARDNYTRAKFTRDYETGRRKKLKGPVQADVEDEIKYGRRESVRIAKRQNKGMTRERAEQIAKNKQTAKTIASVAVSGLRVYNQLSGGKVTKAAFKGGAKLAETVYKGAKAARSVYNNHYNAQILDSAGKVVARYHDAAEWGEIAVRGLLKA